MDDLITFLRAQLDKDAEQAYSGWARDPEGRWENMDEGNSVMTPRAVLADVAAKREIVRTCTVTLNAAAVAKRLSQGQHVDTGPADLAEHILRTLALPYARHPDYRETWKP